MNILVIIIIAVLLLSVLEGYKNGFFKTAFSLVSWIIALIICNVATPLLTEMIIEETDVEITIQAVLDAKINEVIENAMEEIGASQIQESVVFVLPEELQAALPEELKNMLVMGDTSQTGLVDTAAIAERVVGGIALLIGLIFSRMVIFAANVVFGIASKLPLIGPLDKLLGLACGAAKGFIWSWVILTIVSVLALTGVNTEWVSYISQSEILMWLQNNNLILYILI